MDLLVIVLFTRPKLTLTKSVLLLQVDILKCEVVERLFEGIYPEN